jgi:hypothetical protein
MTVPLPFDTPLAAPRRADARFTGRQGKVQRQQAINPALALTIYCLRIRLVHFARYVSQVSCVSIPVLPGFSHPLL